ncbi:hypothetical protein MCOR22_011678 [Pyricularia oryzae]|nr:hypothetical protein MCOR22_011678 [Pyricularia oryzae]
MNLFKSIAVGVAHNEKPRLISTSTLWWKPLGQADGYSSAHLDDDEGLEQLKMARDHGQKEGNLS